MNANPQHHQNQHRQNSEVTLTTINSELTRMALPILSRERANAILNVAPREKFISAVFAANNDHNAKQYIAQLFRQTGIFEAEKVAPLRQQPSQQAAAPQPAPQPPEPAAHPTGGGNAQNAPRHPVYPAPSRNEQHTPREREGRAYNESFHVYGGKAALCFEADTTRANVATIAIDGAAATAPRTYNWGNKIRIQLTRQELPEVAAVFIGARRNCSFKSHGPQKDKGFEIERQDGGKVFVKVFGGNGQGACAVPIMPNDAFYATSLVLRQLMAATGLNSIADVTALLWATHGQR